MFLKVEKLFFYLKCVKNYFAVFVIAQLTLPMAVVFIGCAVLLPDVSLPLVS